MYVKTPKIEHVKFHYMANGAGRGEKLLSVKSHVASLTGN